MDLSVIVPVYNAAEHIRPLAEQFLSMRNQGLSVEIHFVDDGSHDGSQDIIERLAGEEVGVKGHFNKANMGAGLSRNVAWKEARGDYTLFFDADDIPHTKPIPDCLDAMRLSEDIDVGFFSYAYDRGLGDQKGMSPLDRKIFDECLQGQSAVSILLDEFPRLLLFTNYPWNKIISTRRFRDSNFAFGSTKVHNDILAHWTALINARRILISCEKLCSHVVLPDGKNLTNIKGSNRFLFIDALREVHSVISNDDRYIEKFSANFWELSTFLYHWNRDRIPRSDHGVLNFRYGQLLKKMRPEELSLIPFKCSPRVADLLLRRLVN